MFSAASPTAPAGAAHCWRRQVVALLRTVLRGSQRQCRPAAPSADYVATKRAPTAPCTAALQMRRGADGSVAMPLRASQWCRHLSRLCRVSAAGGRGQQSVDSDDEGDSGVTREFEPYEIERFRQMGRHLDLMWNVDRKRKPQPCDCCNASGTRACQYCHSTGAMMVGHERFCSLEQGCKPCPICNGTGEVKCQHCQGTGLRAGWLEPGCPIK